MGREEPSRLISDLACSTSQANPLVSRASAAVRWSGLEGDLYQLHKRSCRVVEVSINREKGANKDQGLDYAMFT